MPWGGGNQEPEYPGGAPDVQIPDTGGAGSPPPTGGNTCPGGYYFNQVLGRCICPELTHHEEEGFCKPGPAPATSDGCPPGQHRGGGHRGNPCLPDKPGAAPSSAASTLPTPMHSEGDMQDLLYTMFLDRLGGFQTTAGLGTELPGYNERTNDVLNLPGGGIASGYLPTGLTGSPFQAYAPPPTSSMDLALGQAKKKLGAPTPGEVHGGPAGIGGKIPPGYVPPPVYKPPYKPPVRSPW